MRYIRHYIESLRFVARTFSQILQRDIIELLDLLHDMLALVDLHDERCAARISAREAKFPERFLELIWDVDGPGLISSAKCAPQTSARMLTMMEIGERYQEYVSCPRLRRES